MRLFLVVLCLLQGVFWARLANAEVLSMLARGSAVEVRGAFIKASVSAEPQGASLFTGGRTGMFAPIVRPQMQARGTVQTGPYVSRVAALRDLIARAEAGPKGYDAVQYGARIGTPRPPTQLSVSQIFQWIEATPGQPHAIGRYQFIPKTLRALTVRLKIDPNARFSPALQDRLADALLADAGMAGFLARTLPRQDFMNNLARIWAGLPNHTGKSHYHGHAGNKATMSWASFEAAMTRIFPS